MDKEERINQELIVTFQIFIALMGALMLWVFGLYKGRFVMYICGALLVVYVVIAKYIVKTTRG